MIIIQTQADLDRLRLRGALDPALAACLTQQLVQLFKALAEADETLNTFTLAERGPIIFLNSHDTSSDLETVGLSSGLLGSSPEFVEEVDLGDRRLWFAGVLINNERMISLFAVSGQIAPEIEAWFLAGR